MPSPFVLPLKPAAHKPTTLPARVPMHFLLAILLGNVCLVASAANITLCNGHPELCDRSYGNITFAGAHDSYAISSDPLDLARSQDIDITSQLNLGIRLFQAQSHMSNGAIHFCHTSCALFDGGTVLSYLMTVKAFLDSHPNEVITFLFTNPEGLSTNNVWLPVFQASGIDQYAYIPPKQPMLQTDWPTLAELISTNKRLIVFLDFGPKNTSDTVPFIMFEFQNIWEPPFDSTNNSFPCSVNRVSQPPAVADHMYLLNHFLDISLIGILIPDKLAAGNTNSVASIMANANGCTQFANGRAPNFVLVDWVNEGQVLNAVALLNGLQPNSTSSLPPSFNLLYLLGSLLFIYNAYL